jgi:hypothetical protein
VVDGVLLEEDGDEGGGGDGDEGADDAGESCSEEEGDEDGETHEVDAGAHDAGDEDGIFEVDVDEIEDEDAGQLGPGVECGDDGGDADGDDSAGDGDDVEEAHEEAEEDEVADVEESEDDGADDAEDEHEGSLADEPFADSVLGTAEGGVETRALRGGEEREEEAVGVLAFEHEVDAEEGGGEDVEDVREPEGERGEEIFGGGVEGSGGALGDGVEAELVGEGEFADSGGHIRDALGEVRGEVAEVAEDRREAGCEEEGKDEDDSGNEEDDSNGARGVVVADFELGDAIDGGHEDYGEEGAAVEDEELFFEGVGERQKEEDAHRKENVTADVGTRSVLVRREVFGRCGGQLDSPGC